MTPENATYTTGVVTIVFTDIEGYSDLERQYGAGLQPALDAHFEIFREAYAKSEGEGKTELRVVGDAFFYTFEQPSHAVQFCVETQRVLRAREWFAANREGVPEPIEMRVRMGIHIGEVRAIVHQATGQSDIFGTSVNKAARISAAGHGQQVLLSEAVRLLANEQLLPPQISFKDLGRHRLKGVGEEHIWQLQHPDLASEFKPIITLDTHKHNLPLPVSPFFGREKELLDWTTALLKAPETKRLTTISGFGGMGKTRLALQIAEDASEEFTDGTWWIPLENARTGDEMVQRIAEVLIQNLKPQPTVREQLLLEFHRDRKMLLVLDNLEQIDRDQAAEVLDKLLQAGPRIRILATSRRTTGMLAEELYELEPFPGVQAEVLFAERAKARDKSFVLNNSNAADVAAICRKLEGVPLAIEIAASRITLMAPRQMLAFLDKQMAQMQALDPTMKPRQKALRAAVEWSYNLLSEEVRSLFSQLSVFAGGFFIESAIGVVCREDDTPAQGDCQSFDEYSILEGLMELRNQSLLRAQEDEETGEKRLTMLESVREYALFKLGENKAAENAARKRHAQYFCRWAGEQDERLRTSDEAKTLAAFEREFDNLRGAFSWAKDHDALLCGRLATVFANPLDVFGHAEEARNYLKNAWIAVQTLPADGEVLRLRGALRHTLAGLLDDIGEKAPARALANQSLGLYQQAQDNRGAANAFNLLAVLATQSNEYDAARHYCAEALKLWPANDLIGRGKTLHNRGQAAQRAGDLPEARQWYEEALKLRRTSGDEHGMAKTLGNLGTIAQDEGNMEEAGQYYGQSLPIWRKLRHRCNTAIALNNLGDLAALKDQNERAIILLIHAQRIFTDLKSPYAEYSAKSLDELKARLGEDEYSRLHQSAQGKAWEDWVT